MTTLRPGMRVEIGTVFTDDRREALASDAVLAGLRAKLSGEGMFGWFESYPRKPNGNTVLCAACAADPVRVGKLLATQRLHADQWDGVEDIRPIDPAFNNPEHGYCATRSWTCLSCHKRGWPLDISAAT